MAQDRPINFQLLNEISLYKQAEWPPFSKAKLINVINKCHSLFTLDLDHISWNYFKEIVNDAKYITHISK